MVIAITGSTGFIGTNLVNRLKEQGYELLEVCIENGIDVTKKDELNRIKKFDCIIHLAGKVSIPDSFKFTYDYFYLNFVGTLNVLELCRKYDAKMIFASSYVYGSPIYLPIDENHPVQANNPYTQSKIMGEQLCQEYSKDFGLSCIALRTFNVYGIKMLNNLLIPTILKQVQTGQIIINDIRPRRDYVYVDDIVEAYVASISYENKGFEAFNIASGISHSVDDIVQIVKKKVSAEIQVVDKNQPRLNEVFNIIGSNNKAKIKLGWEPKISFEEGINKLIDHYYQSETSTRIFNSYSQTNIIDNSFIPLSVPSLRGNEWNYIKECLQIEWVSSAGTSVNQFELKIAEYTGAKYTIACVNGTSALHTSLLISGVKSEDEIIVPTLTFIAPINVIRYCGAYPVFMDADKYYNIDITKTIEFILNETKMRTTRMAGEESCYSYNKKTGRRISAIIPVHIFGNAVWLDDLYKLCKEKNIKIVEDATESLGTKYREGKFKGKHTGTVGELGCLSFNGNKIITTGGGGMILTDNEEYAIKAKYLTTQAKDDDLRYIHNEIGYNYRLTNILAALGLAQLEQLQDYLKIKKENYFYYKEHIDNIEGLHIAELPDYSDNNYWMYCLQIDQEKYYRDKEMLRIFLSQNNIQVRPVWYLNHLQRVYKECQSYHIEQANILHRNTLNLPCSVNLNKNNIERIIKKLNER